MNGSVPVVEIVPSQHPSIPSHCALTVKSGSLETVTMIRNWITAIAVASPMLLVRYFDPKATRKTSFPEGINGPGRSSVHTSQKIGDIKRSDSIDKDQYDKYWSGPALTKTA